MRVNHNLEALGAWGALSRTNSAMSKTLKRLSTGLRVNSAADDAAGLAVSEKMRAQVKGFEVARRNAQDAISLIQTAEGAAGELQSIVGRMRELALQSASGTLTDSDRAHLNEELRQLQAEIDRIASQTEFNTMTILDGSFSTKLAAGSDIQEGGAVGGGTNNLVFSKVNVSNAKAGETFTFEVLSGGEVRLSSSSGISQTISLHDMTSSGNANQVLNFGQLGVSVTLSGVDAANTAADIGAALNGRVIETDVASGAAEFQIGANANQKISLAIGDLSSAALGIDAASIDISTQAGADAAIVALDAAINTISSERAKLGAVQNRLESTISNLMVSEENIQAAESRIRDADIVRTMMDFTRQQILQQTGTAMVATANAQPQAVLSLF